MDIPGGANENDRQLPAVSAGANYTLTINNPPPPTINTNPAQPAGAKNLAYSFAFTASGFAPLTWGKSGTLPAGLVLGTDGSLSGTPTTVGSFPIHVTVTDAAGQVSATDDVTIEIFPHGFKVTGSMAEAREGHTATLLTNGKVLVAGGSDNSTIFGTAEIFDPASGSFASTGSMVTTRYDHTATLLLNGNVLVAGGDNASGATAELYDPASGAFTLTGSMTIPRTGQTTTLLANGKVLVTGGMDGNGMIVATAELFDPVSGTFASTGNMGTTRRDHAATLLTNGKVLVTGGMDANAMIGATAEIFDPASGTFASTSSICRRSPTCAADHPNSDAEFEQLIQTIRTKPLQGHAYDASGNLTKVRVDEARLLNIAINTMGNFVNVGELLAAGDAVAKDDPAPLLRLGAEITPLVTDHGDPTVFSQGAHYATYSSDAAQP